MTRPYRIVASSRDREIWLKARTKVITASDVHIALKPGTKNYERLVAEKRGEIEPVDLSRNELVMPGTFSEEGILKFWAHFERMRARCTPFLCVSKQYPFLGATADGLAWHPSLGYAGVVEIKFANVLIMGRNGRPVKILLDNALRRWENGPPAKYELQHDTQMFVLGKRFGWIVASVGFSRPRDFPRAFDSRARLHYEQEHIPKLEQFARDARLI